nr:MAG TPA: hypothetical protein [Caudoviricetes sp.]
MDRLRRASHRPRGRRLTACGCEGARGRVC